MANRSRIKQDQSAVAISRQTLNEHANQIGIVLTKLTEIKNTLDTSAPYTTENRDDTHRNPRRKIAELEKKLTKIIDELQDGQVLFLQTIKPCGNTFVVEDKSASSLQDILARVKRVETVDDKSASILSKLADIDKQQSSTLSWLGHIKQTLDNASVLVDEREERHKNLTDTIQNLSRDAELRERLVSVITDVQDGQSRILQAIDQLGNTPTPAEANAATAIENILTSVTRMEDRNRRHQDDTIHRLNQIYWFNQGQSKLAKAFLCVLAGGAIIATCLIVAANRQSSYYLSGFIKLRSSIGVLIADITLKAANGKHIDAAWVLAKLFEIY